MAADGDDRSKKGNEADARSGRKSLSISLWVYQTGLPVITSSCRHKAVRDIYEKLHSQKAADLRQFFENEVKTKSERVLSQLLRLQ